MRHRHITLGARCLCVLAAFVGLQAGPIPSNKPSHFPDWWFEHDVIASSGALGETSIWPDNYKTADDFAVANLGQLKLIATRAAAQMEATFPGGAGTAINNLVTPWSQTPAPGQVRDDFAVLNQGQLKSVAKLFYDRLAEFDYSDQPLSGSAIYPWTSTPDDDASFNVVNLGQLKKIFSFKIVSPAPPPPVDTDGDEMPDSWEILYGFDPLDPADGNLIDDGLEQDFDSDGLSNYVEFLFGSNPTLADSDSDGLDDSGELAWGTEPLISDTDGDGLPDGWEDIYRWPSPGIEGIDPKLADTDNDGINDAADDADSDGLSNLLEFQLGTNPQHADSDGDGITDGADVTAGTNPLLTDTDGDGLDDAFEISLGTSPLLADTDADGLPDAWEYLYRFPVGSFPGFNPTVADDSNLDHDADGLSNYGEFLYHTHPQNPDTDEDGVTDGWEVVFGTSPILPDTDADGLPDQWELLHSVPVGPIAGLNPTTADATLDNDSDGLNNLAEFQHNTDPQNPDSDSDSLPDGAEVSAGTNPLLADTDGDSLADAFESSIGTNPLLADTDGDGLNDAWEYQYRLPFGTIPGFNPTTADDANLDEDNDGLSSLFESWNQTSPFLADTDSDGLDDLGELLWSADPTLPDTDGDGMTDGWENLYRWPSTGIGALDPLNPNDATLDADSDGLSNLLEFQLGTNPQKSDTDGDGIPDGWEYLYHLESGSFYGLNPLDAADASLDFDGDGISNLAEFQQNTNPQVPNTPTVTELDTDNDGLSDAFELSLGMDANSSNGMMSAPSLGLHIFTPFEYAATPSGPSGPPPAPAPTPTPAPSPVPSPTSPPLPEVSISKGPDPREPATHSFFTITRTGPTLLPLVVNFYYSGTATPGSDFQTLPTSVTILPGQSSINIPVIVKDDYLVEEKEIIMLLVVPHAIAYRSSSFTRAQLVIHDDDFDL